MPDIQSVRIQRFKNLSDVFLELDELNVLVGANNSGKSSVIQALHFGVGLLQTIDIAGRWPAGGQDEVSVSVYPNQPLYSPTEDLYSLAEGGRLREAAAEAIRIEFTMEQGQQVIIQVRKGRNRNAAVTVNGIADARRIGQISEPFSVFSPGLAGVAKNEPYVSDGVLLRTIARGDSNLVLRNLLFRLWRARGESDGWHHFMEYLRSMFKGVDLRLRFEPGLDEYIHVDVNVGDDWVPIELSGTGILQATQILAYLHHFRPSMVVLDEPDSHLHPNNQRLLCGLLEEIARERGTQVILTTHSRHVVDALSGAAKFQWLRGGIAEGVAPDDEIGVLLDIGALDVKERLAIPGMRAVVLTEDKDTRLLQEILSSCGFDLPSTVILPYYGVSNVAAVKPLLRVIRETNPEATVVVHRDRDYFSEADIRAWEERVRRERCQPFATPGVDLEALSLSPDHLAAVNDELDLVLAAEIVAAARESVRGEAVASYVNGRIDAERKEGRGGVVNPGALAVEGPDLLAREPDRYFRGKTLLAAARRLFRERFPGASLQTHVRSVHLRQDELAVLAQATFGRLGLEE